MVQGPVWKGLYKITRDVAKNTYFQISSTKSLGVEAWESVFLISSPGSSDNFRQNSEPMT